MIVKLFGLLDIIAAVLLFAAKSLPSSIAWVAAGYLIIKGLIFILGNDLVSYVDIVIGAYFVLIAFGLSFTVVSVLFGLFLAQKGLMSLI